MTDSRREIKDVFYLVALQGVNYVMPLVVFPYLMVVLGAEKFGYIGFSISLTQYLMLVVDFGFNFTATKEVALHKDNHEKLQKVFWSVTAAKTVLLLLTFVLLVVVAFGIPRFSIYRSTLLVCFLMVVSSAYSCVWYFQGLGKIRVISVVNVLSKLFILPLCFLFVKTADDYLKAAFLQSGIYISGTLFTLLYLRFSRRMPPSRVVIPTRTMVSGELKSAWPVFLSGAVSSLYVLLFTVILGYFASPDEVGRYSAAERIMRSFCYLIFVPVLQAFFPKLSSLAQTDGEGARRLFRRISMAMVAAMLGVFVGLFFFSDTIMTFLGKDYGGVEKLFRIMAVVPLFVALGGVAGQLGLLAMGDDCDKRHYRNVYFVAAAVALLAVFLLLPAWHSVGAAWALLITEVVTFSLMTWCARRFFYSYTKV